MVTLNILQQSIAVITSFNKTVKTILTISMFCLIFVAVPVYASEEESKVNIDADKLSYEDASGIATAEGNVVVKNKNMRMYAPFAKYDTSNEQIEAFSDQYNEVSLLVDGKKLSGNKLNYNVATRRGVMSNAHGKMDAIFFKGKDLQVMPLDDAVKQKLISTKQRKKTEKDDLVAKWLDVESTTCGFTNPHYKFVAKSIIVIPNKRVIIKQPQVFIGKRMIFRYPFDYVAPIDKREKSGNILPMISYDSNKGVGIGISGPFVWDSGKITVDAAYWTDDIWEAKLKFYQKIGEYVSIFAETERTYNKDDKDILWRPRWGVRYADANGWSATLMESQRELVETEMRPGMDRRYNVWRSPELQINSPWFNDASANTYFRFMGIWGRYQDNVEYVKPWVERIGVGLQVYGEPTFASAAIKPFYNASYWYYDYGSEESTQKVGDAVVGLRWNIGAVELGTAYVRRWVSGASPLVWDRYLVREDIYQKVSFSIPGKNSYEKWTVSVRGAYDLEEDRLAEMVYSLAYDQHCITWELWARESRPDDDFSIGVKFYINAYPESELSLGINEIYDPFAVPSGIKRRNDR